MPDIETKDKIYFIRYPGEEKAKHIVMLVDTHYQDFQGLCFAELDGHPHMIEGKIGRKTDAGFTFISEGAFKGEWELVEMTYDNFCDEFYQYVIGGDKLKQQCCNTEELQDYYNGNFPDYG